MKISKGEFEANGPCNETKTYRFGVTTFVELWWK